MSRNSVSFGGKVAAIAVYLVLWWVGYSYTNEYGARSDRAISFTPPTQTTPELLQPWTAIIYVGGASILPLVVYYHNWSWSKLAFVLVAYGVTSLLAFACYLLWPVRIARSSFDGPGVGLWLMREVVAVDDAANCTPSSHVFYAVLAGLLVGRSTARWSTRVAVWVLAVAVCVTTITTGQHYYMDIPTGVAAALVGYFAARAIFPTEPRADRAP